MPAAVNTTEALFNLAMLALVAFLAQRFLRRRPTNSTAHGSSFWLTEKLLRQWGMLGQGIVLGRSLGGSLIRVRDYVHVLIIGGTGSGKGIGFVIPNLLTYFSGSMCVFDTKGDLFNQTAKQRRRHGDTLVRLNPFDDTADQLNPLDLIKADDPLLIDEARAAAASLVVSDPGDREKYWSDRARELLSIIIVYVLKRAEPDERNLNSVQNIASSSKMLSAMAAHLKEMKGIYERFADKVLTLFDKDGSFTKEGNGVITTMSRSLSFLDSEKVGRSVSATTFDPQAIRKPGMTVYLQIAPHMLEANKGLLRLWVSRLMRVVSSHDTNEETLFLLDECSALGELPAIEEGLVRGRSAGVRMALIYQSESQVRTAFHGKPTLLFDNCSTQVYLGATSVETAEAISKRLGNYTEEVVTHSSSYGATDSPTANGSSRNQGGGTNSNLIARALLDVSEVLRMGNAYLFAFVAGLPAPILGLRIKWYEDRAFTGGGKGTAKRVPLRQRLPLSWRLFIVVAVILGVLVVRAKVNQTGYWQPEPIGEKKWQK